MSDDLPKRRSANFDTLDGMRGVAAICVAFMHAQALFVIYPYSGFLAVDFFFALSGFVIAHAYEQRLKDGLGPMRFAAIRFVRLYPMYILGVALALGARFVGGALHLGPSPAPVDAVAWTLFEAMFLPVPDRFHPEAHHLFPGLFPAWSLFFEMAINIAYGFVGRCITTVRLAVILAVSSVFLVWQIAAAGTIDNGGVNTDYLMGFARVLYSFFAGVMIFRLRKSGWTAPRLDPKLALVLLLGIFFAPTHGAIVPVFQAGCALLLFPAMVFVFSFAQTEAREKRACHLLGLLSYPVYVLHAPIFFGFSRTIWRLKLTNSWALASLGTAFIAVTLIAAYILEKRYEKPARAWLGRRLLR